MSILTVKFPDSPILDKEKPIFFIKIKTFYHYKSGHLSYLSQQTNPIILTFLHLFTTQMLTPLAARKLHRSLENQKNDILLPSLTLILPNSHHHRFHKKTVKKYKTPHPQQVTITIFRKILIFIYQKPTL